ncbi:MAG: heavy-metal-associated domain-containing protein [Atopobiaceae bacterium]|nr:heavy-metal-associated domain-containing protein [Atopobiaceae bacterium]MDO4404787.1 heavy metal-associated domain-containing protein [Atopobiaceae bacterium]
MIQTVIGIDGMMCDMCEAHINDAIRKNFPVKSAKSNRKKKQCVVVSEEALDEERIRKVIARTGYDLLSISSEPYQKKGLFGLW